MMKEFIFSFFFSLSVLCLLGHLSLLSLCLYHASPEPSLSVLPAVTGNDGKDILPVKAGVGPPTDFLKATIQQ